MAIKAVIFDCFGVLTSEGLLPFRDKYFGDTPELMDQAVLLSRRVDAGLLGYDDLIQGLARLANIEPLAARKEIEDNTADEQLFMFIRDTLKLRYKIGMLSNAGDNWINQLFAPWQVALFDEIALSYQTGFMKPSHEAYESIATELGMLPEECLFVDDQERYVSAAKEVGMTSFQFTDTPSFIKKFEELQHEN